MKISDINMERTKALPAAGAAAVSDSVDLYADEVGPVGANLEVHLELPALASLVDDKTCTITFQDSADDSTFAAVAGAPTLTLTGAGGAGAAADKVRFYLPPATRQYVRFSVAVAASGGDNTAASATMKFRV